MSQGQSLRPQPDQGSDQLAINYGDVFDVSGGLASTPIAPRDAATMLAAETQVLGKPLDAGAAAVMYSAAAANITTGVVGPDEGNEMVEREGVAVSKSRDARGKLVVNEAIADKMLCEYRYNPYDVRGITLSPAPAPNIRDEQWKAPSSNPTPTPPIGAVDRSGGNITVGEALEATTLSIAQAAATFNDRQACDHNMITISDVLSDATQKLPLDKAVTAEDAAAVKGVEEREKPDMVATPGGVDETLETAAAWFQLHTSLSSVNTCSYNIQATLSKQQDSTVTMVVCRTEPAAPSLNHPHAPATPPTLLLSFLLFTLQFPTLKGTMSQQQPRRPQPDYSRDQEDPIKYGDVFNVSGELASKPIAPLHASAMQSAETTVLGQTRRSGPAAVMQSAARVNERAGVVRHHQTDFTGDEGVTVTKSTAGGESWITEAVEGQAPIMDQVYDPTPSLKLDLVTPSRFLNLKKSSLVSGLVKISAT
ncbi:Late embryoproteinsis abundant protein D-34 [Hibiscus syriacus]|uniref:Late embryoproteinsis abundant protein D-34 n=1 Tax=Hibiscus syriacus TaxID=106335 RepID=A0A6A2WLV7_HIBSY|nr:Late embryoproteinsis abundant protein D-34 [Hibiscus syriacus]